MSQRFRYTHSATKTLTAARFVDQLAKSEPFSSPTMEGNRVRSAGEANVGGMSRAYVCARTSTLPRPGHLPSRFRNFWNASLKSRTMLLGVRFPNPFPAAEATGGFLVEASERREARLASELARGKWKRQPLTSNCASSSLPCLRLHHVRGTNVVERRYNIDTGQATPTFGPPDTREPATSGRNSAGVAPAGNASISFD